MRVVKAVEECLCQLIGHGPMHGEASRVDGLQVIERAIRHQTTQLLG